MAPLCGIDGRASARGRAALCRAAAASMIFWGMGISPARPRHRQRPLPDRAGPDHRPGRPARHGAAPAARPEQRPGRLGRRPDPDGLPRLPVGRDAEIRERFEALWGTALDPKRGLTVVEIMQAIHAGADQGDVHHGREPGDVRPRRAACPRGAGQARASGGPGHLPDRDGLACRRGAAGLRLAGEDRHASPTPTARCRSAARRSAAGRGAAGLVDHPGAGAAHRASPGTTAHPREVFAEMAQVMPSLHNITWERLEREERVTYPCDAPDEPGNEIIFADGFPTADAAAPSSCPPICCRPTSCPTPIIPMVLTDRPAARALAHRRHDAPRHGARRVEPEAVALLSPRDLRRMERRPRRLRCGSRRGAAPSSSRRAPTATCRTAWSSSPSAIAEAAGQPAHQPRARPVRQDPRVQVLRGEGGAGAGAGGGGGVASFFLRHSRESGE